MTTGILILALSSVGTIALMGLAMRWPRSALVRWYLRFLDGLTVVGATIAFVVLMGCFYVGIAVAVIDALFG